jgi:hypothetical protein
VLALHFCQDAVTTPWDRIRVNKLVGYVVRVLIGKVMRTSEQDVVVDLKMLLSIDHIATASAVSRLSKT